MELVDLAPREGIRMVELEPVIFNISVKVTGNNTEGEVTVQLPAEVRPTERLVSYLHTVLKARGLEIKRWTLDEAQQKELENLSNVMVEEQTEEGN